MNTNDLLASWSALSLEEIEARLEAGVDDEAGERLLGAEEMAEMRALVEEPHLRGLMAAPQAGGLREAVVLLPGLMGSLLSSIRGVTKLLWINPAIFLKGQSSHLELAADGTRDRAPEIEGVPFAVEKLVYLKISIALSRQTDLYEFPYDWRRPIESNGDLLHQTIERWADGDPDRQFTLVGHSMGGIVSRAYLARHPEAAERRIKRVIMHGTPHFGAAGAVEGLALGNRSTAVMEKLNEKNAPQRLMLNMPSVYQLLPVPPEFFPSVRPYPANWDLYDAAAWRLEGLRQDYLDAARRFHELLVGADHQVDMVEIAGCHIDTVVDVRRSLRPDGEPEYALIRVAEGPDGGDGTVPLWSAVLPGARMYYIQQGHRYLPKNGEVIEATLELIHGGTPDLPTELPPRRAGLFASDAAALPPVEVEADRLRTRLEEGTATEEDLSLLYLNL
jgi:pimeloyl-ACP methyl ester carboxylesterase